MLFAGIDTSSQAEEQSIWVDSAGSGVCLSAAGAGASARHAEVQQQLREEVRECDLAVTRGTPLLLSCLEEAMRLYPPVPAIPFRLAERDTALCGLTFPRLSHFRLPVGAQQPARLGPRRGAVQAGARRGGENGQFRRRRASLPGRTAARLEIRYMVIYLLQRYRLSLPPGFVDSELWSPRGTLGSSEGIQIQFQKL